MFTINQYSQIACFWHFAQLAANIIKMPIPLLVLLLLLLAPSLSQQRRTISPNEYLYNVLERNEQYLLKVWVQHGDELIASKDFDLIYSLEQPEIIENFTLPLSNLTSNISLQVSLFKLFPQFTQIAHETRNLTRYQKIRKVEQEGTVGSYDPIDEIVPSQPKEEEAAEYGLHVAVDFNLMVIFCDAPFHQSQSIPPNTGIKRLSRAESGRQLYTTGIDLSQLHIPFKSYLPLSRANDTHTFSLHIFPYDVIKYSAFYSLAHPQRMFEHLGPMGALVQSNLMDDAAMDELKEILFTNHVYLVAAFFILSLSQTILRFFTLRQEYRFWKEIQNNKGVSLKTLFYELVFSIILTLYVYQHNSSRMIIGFSLLDIAVTVWKISRTFTIKVSKDFPWVRLETSQVYRKREKIDSQAVWYMNYILVPLMVVYLWWALHSKAYVVKDYYSFLLETAVAFIAIFGFIMMTPQLYINYRLKSVEHLNWRGLIYRFINTLLDDLFAFMVAMPTLRRLMYFRDDVVFLIYLYQRWIYRVDPSRRAPDSEPAPTTAPIKEE